MKSLKLLSCSICFAVALPLIFSTCQDPAGIGGVASIRGRVLIEDELSQQRQVGAASGVPVQIYYDRIKNSPDFEVFTDEQGEFSLYGLNKGNYWIRCAILKNGGVDDLNFVSADVRVMLDNDEDKYIGDLLLLYQPNVDLYVKVIDSKYSQPLPKVPVYIFNNEELANLTLSGLNNLISPVFKDTSKFDGTIFKTKLPFGQYFAVVNDTIGNVVLVGMGKATVDQKNAIHNLILTVEVK